MCKRKHDQFGFPFLLFGELEEISRTVAAMELKRKQTLRRRKRRLSSGIRGSIQHSFTARGIQDGGQGWLALIALRHIMMIRMRSKELVKE